MIGAGVEAVAPPAAPVRVTAERGYSGSALANAPPIADDPEVRRTRMHDRAADQRFVEAVAPALSPEARERAQAVRSRRATRRRSCWGRPASGDGGERGEHALFVVLLADGHCRA